MVGSSFADTASTMEGSGGSRRGSKRKWRKRGRGAGSSHQSRGQLSVEENRMKVLMGPLYNAIRLKDFVEQNSYPINCPISVSTRGIGFMISRLESMLRQEVSSLRETIPIAELYRVSLAQLQIKVCCSNEKMYPTIPLASCITPIDGIGLSGSLNMMRNFSQIAFIIDSIGNVELNGSRFCPVLLKDLSPLNLCISNLRDYCEAMANPETEKSLRVKGFKLNSIPHARWVKKNENDLELKNDPVLENPDEIMPLVYKEPQLFNDMFAIRRFIDGDISLRGFGVKAEISYDNCRGNPGLLVSTHVAPGQCLVIENGVLKGDESDFWSRESIDDDSWFTGILSLAGEISDIETSGQRSILGATRCLQNWSNICPLVL